MTHCSLIKSASAETCINSVCECVKKVSNVCETYQCFLIVGSTTSAREIVARVELGLRGSNKPTTRILGILVSAV